MNLSEFVEGTLTQILTGVRSAQEKAKSVGGTIVPAKGACYNLGNSLSTNQGFVQEIRFDVAVTTSDRSEAKAGGGIFVAAFTAGAQGSSAQQNQTVSRIQFNVPVVLPASYQT